MSTNVVQQTEEILKKVEIPDRHTFFQIEKFIVGKEPTAQAQLWAIVRELQARKETVETFQKDLQDAEDNLELFDLKIDKLNRRIQQLAGKKGRYTDLNIQECEISIRKLQREKQSLILASQKVNNKLKCTIEEMACLNASYEKIVAIIGPMKPLDDEVSQKEMWDEKLLEEFNLRLILQKPLDPEFVRTVLCLHNEATVRKNIVALIESVKRGMASNKLNTQKRPQIEGKARTIGK